MALAIETEGLVKRFGATSAVDGVDLQVRQGAVYGVLGPNGAGKSTTIRILATLLRPDAGTARVFGHDVVRDADAARRAIGLTGQSTSVDEELSGLENLILVGRLVGYRPAEAKRRAGELLEVFDLTDVAGRLVKTYSGGEQRRLDVAASLVVTPELLFLDEPTTGIDPRSRNDVWQIVRAIVAGGGTVLLTTQYLDEADALADRIALLDHGKVVAEGTPADLKSSIGFGALRVSVTDPARRAEAEKIMTRTLGADVHQESDPARLSVSAIDPDRGAEAVAELRRAGIGLSDFALAQPSLDEVFLTLTGDRGHDEGAGTKGDPS